MAQKDTYEYTKLGDIIDYFTAVYVGEGKTISKVNRVDVAFHAQRALQELSYDTLKSTRSREITVPSSLQMELPEDYVNYTKISWVDSAGIKHPLYPTSKTSNPTKYQADSNGDYLLDMDGNYIPSGELIKNGDFDGGIAPWILNVGSLSGIAQPFVLAAGTSADPITNSIGWFWDNNAIVAYNAPYLQGFKQLDIPIYDGEQYTVTYTISGYSQGAVKFCIVDENGHYTDATNRTANGTYTETITASLSLGDGTYEIQSFGFKSSSSNADLNATIDNVSIVRVGDEESSVTWGNYKSGTPSENNNDDYEDDTYWPMEGSRFGLDPQHAQANGSFYMDSQAGKIHFSSNISGKTIVLDYIGDGLDGELYEMLVHKFAEEAVYKWILHAVLSTRANTPEQLVRRYKRERFAAIRQAKLRLSNIKLEEITQILRGKSKQIKH